MPSQYALEMASLAKSKRKSEVITLPSCGMQVKVRAMSAAENAAAQAAGRKMAPINAKDAGKADIFIELDIEAQNRAKLVGTVMHPETGEALYDKQTVALAGDLEPEDFDAMVAAVERLSGTGKEDSVENAKKSSEPSPTDSTSTLSLVNSAA